MASTRAKLLHIRIKARDLAAWKAAAKRADMTLSAWLREAGDAKAREEAAQP
jgi:hypothetical protein